MSDQFLGEIRLFAGNFAPANWKICNGELLTIVDHTALFSLLGTFYGGDGKTTFALPDLRDRVPIHQGTGPGRSPYGVGEMVGDATVTLALNEIPSHTHTVTVNATAATAATGSPVGEVWAVPAAGTAIYAAPAASGLETPMGAALTDSTGTTQPHNNMQPYLGLNFIIALQGVFPPRG